MATASNQASIVVVCALEFERERLLAAGLSRQFEIMCCGPGAERMRQWMDAHASDTRPIVLAGLAGGLTPGIAVGSAFVVHRISAMKHEMLQSNLRLVATDVQTAMVSCPAKTLTTPVAKRAWHAAHPSDLVDLESEAFARSAMAAGRRWAIVRGVSDGADDALPESIDAWVDEHGRTRRGFIALALLKHPTLVPLVQRLGRNARLAMGAVADVLQRGVAE